MPIIFLLLLFTSNFLFADTVKGLQLIHEGNLNEGYRILESSFQKEESLSEKGRLAYLLAFGTGTENSQVYYARFALKYHKNLKPTDELKLKIRIADSFMEFGEFNKAYELYHGTLQENGPHQNYVNYQLGYYYLNTKNLKKAFLQWERLRGTDLEKQALKSIGRYWEKLGFPGDIQQLKQSPSFIEGFSVSVDEREKELSLQDLNTYVNKKSSPEMLALLIEKNTLFIKKPCDFSKWYKEDLGLSNDLVFPFLKKCYDVDKSMLKNITQLASPSARTMEEKLFVIQLYQEQGNSKKACELASKENFHSQVFILCEEMSEEILSSITDLLKDGDTNLLTQGRVIRSAAKLPVEQRREFKEKVGETRYAREFLDQPKFFIAEAKDHKFSDETKLLFSAYHRQNEHRMTFIGDLQSLEAKELQAYLAEGAPIKSSVCSFISEDLRKMAIESKLITKSYGVDDHSCSEKLITQDENLSFLATSFIIAKAQKLRLKEGSEWTQELVKESDTAFISPMSGNFGREVNLLLKVQDFKIHKATTEAKLLAELKKLKQLRGEILARKWISIHISEKVSSLYNALLDEFVKVNTASMDRLKLASQVTTFINELRLS